MEYVDLGGGAVRKGLVCGTSVVALLTGALLMAEPAVAQTADPVPSVAQREITFHIAGQDLNAALLNFARTAGVQLFYDAEWVAGKRSPGLSGSFTAQQGLSRLLAGTGMAFHFTAANTIALDKLPQSGDAMILDPVAVEGRSMAPPQAQLTEPPPVYAGGQVARGGKLGILGNRDVMDTPFSTTSYTSEVIKNSNSRTLAQALQSDPSVRFTTSGGHINENFFMRGLNLGGSELALNGMYGMAPDGHVPTEFLERVEVLRGPNALLNGMSPGGSVAGAINLVPKRAVDTPVTEITGDFTSGAQLGSHVDLGRRFGTDGRVGVRVNGVLRDGETGVDDQTKKRAMGTVALDYRGDDFRVNLDAYSMREEYDGGSSMMAQFTGAAVAKAPDASTNFFKGITAEQENNAAVLRAEYDITRSLTAFAGFGMADFSSGGFTNSTHGSAVRPDGRFTGQTTNRIGFTETTTSEAGLRSQFETGAVGHETVLSATNLDQATGSSFIRGATYASNLYAPAANPIIAAAPGTPSVTAKLSLTSISLADTLSFLDDRVELTVGARHQTVNSRSFNNGGFETANYEESAVTPAIGLVVKPLSSVSVYANYIEGLTKGSTVTNTNASNYGQTFEPFVSKQHETGVKWDAGTFANTLALYRISQTALSSSGNLFVQSEQVNRGIEWTTFGELTPGVRLLGGIIYTEGEIKKSAVASIIGKTPFGVPKWQGNLGAEWDPSILPGFTLEGRAVYTGEQYINSTNTLAVPEWWRFDAGIRYTMPIQDNTLTLRGYVANLLDHDYWAGSFSDGYVTLSEPRTYMLSATMGF